MAKCKESTVVVQMKYVRENTCMLVTRVDSRIVRIFASEFGVA